MIVKKYKCKVVTSLYKSDFKRENYPPSSDLYIMKENKWLEYKVEVEEDLKKYFIPTIHAKKVYKDYTEFHLNSLNFFFSDVEHNGVFYKYKIKTNKVELSLKEVRSYLRDYSIVKIGNTFYTNNLGYYSSEELKIFTENVINIHDCEVIYKSKYIVIKIPSICEAIPNTTTITPQFINEYSVYIPSFYLKKEDNTLIRCIDSNLTPREIGVNKGYQLYKVISTSDNTSQALNLSFSEDLITLQYSSHILPIPYNYSDFYIEDNGNISDTSKTNIKFRITKEVNLDNIKIIPNNYKYLSNDTNVNDYLKNRVFSFIDVDPQVNSFFDSYLKISKTYPAYVFLEFSFDKRIKMSPRKVTDNPDLSFLEAMEPKEYSCNRVPCLFNTENDIKTRKIVDGVSYVY